MVCLVRVPAVTEMVREIDGHNDRIRWAVGRTDDQWADKN